MNDQVNTFIDEIKKVSENEIESENKDNWKISNIYIVPMGGTRNYSKMRYYRGHLLYSTEYTFEGNLLKKVETKNDIGGMINTYIIEYIP